MIHRCLRAFTATPAIPAKTGKQPTAWRDLVALHKSADSIYATRVVTLRPEEGGNMSAQGNALGVQLPLQRLLRPFRAPTSLCFGPQGVALGCHVAAPLGRTM